MMNLRDPEFILRLTGQKPHRCGCGRITRRELCRKCDRKRMRQLRKKAR